MAEQQKMSRSQLIDAVSSRLGVPKAQVKHEIDTMEEIITSHVKKGVDVVTGLGVFKKQKRKARMGRNPSTGQSIKIAAKTVVKFRVAKAFKDAVL